MADLRLLTSNFLPMHGQSRVRGDLSRTFPRFRCTKLGGYSSGSVSALYISKVRLWEKNQSLESVPRPETTNDISSLGNLIKQYVDSGSPCDAVKVFVEMVECGVSLETFQFFPSLVKGFGDLSNVNKVREIHVYLLKLGFLEDVYVANSLLGAYWKSGGTEDAVQLFEKMPDKESVSWNTMISGFSRSGDHFRSLSTFRNMAGEYGVVPNRVACVSVITSCSALESLVHGREIHGFVTKNGFDDEFMVSGLMNMYMKCKDVKNARNVFKRVLGKEYVKVNTVIWNVMISGCVSNGYLPEALESLSEMLEIGVSLDSSTMVTVLDLCSELLDLEVGKQAHGLAVRFGIDKDVRVEANLVSMYFKCGDEKSGMDIFRRSPNRSKDSLWGSIILNCAQRGRPVEALNLFCSYRIENSFPDPAVTLAALRACSSSNTKSMGLEIHGLVLKSPAFGRDVYIGSALVDVYVKSGDIESAQKVFHNLPYRDLISWNALIVGYAQNGCPEEALRAFRDMQNEKIRPNTVAISCVLTVCSSLSAMALCKEIHGYVFRRSFRSNVLINNSLTSTYAKCGDIQSSLTVFRRMPKRDKVSLNSILLGLSMHGRAGEIIPLFEEAVMSGTKPDHATFSALLSACSHTGRLEEGFEYFKKMVEYYKIEPRIEQYSGMVDLLGRAGNLKQAHDLILAMPCAPDERIWGSLLSSCKIHGDKELATIVADRIMELNPTNISYRILLSNLYEDHGESSEAGRVRSEIKDMGLKKSPGCSWIEVDNNLHTFIASDRSHYRLADIYSALDSLTEQIRAVR